MRPGTILRTSGAAKKVVPYGVMLASKDSIYLAIPKSDNFTVLFSNIKMFAGFKSLWHILTSL